jgi:hypothetical protein
VTKISHTFDITKFGPKVLGETAKKSVNGKKRANARLTKRYK